MIRRIGWASLTVFLLCWTVEVTEVLRVLDGDTLQARLSIWTNLTAVETIRLLGVDTPERHGATKAAGEAARTFTEAWLAGHKDVMTVWACRRDSFGRLLGGVSADGTTLTSALLAAGHGRVYERGK